MGSRTSRFSSLPRTLREKKGTRMKNHRLMATAFTAALLVAAIMSPITSHASSHSEAPGTAKDRLSDDTDLYAWVSPDASDRVTIVGNWVPMIEPGSGPNFHGFDDEVSYWFNIDNVGDATNHIRYRFTFNTTRQTGATFLYNTGVVTSLTDPDLHVRQTYTVTRYDGATQTVLGSDLPVVPAYVGPVSMPDYAQLAASAVMTLSDGSKVFVGPRDDPFFVDLAATFDLLTIRKPPGNVGRGLDGLGGFDVMTVALQIPMTRLTSDGLAPTSTTSVIGLYASAERPASRTLNGDGTVSTSGAPVQVSRLGNPLVNEVVIALQDKDKFNASAPVNDGQFAGHVVDPELAKLLHALYGINTPPAPRNDLVTVFLTGIPGLNKPANPNQVPCEMLRLNMSVAPTSHPSRFGILAGDNAGFPNGRRLGDDVVDIAERVVAGATPFTPAFNVAPNNQLGDGVDANDVPFLPYFPYVALPHNPLNHVHHESTGDGRRRDHGNWGRGVSAEAGIVDSPASTLAGQTNAGPAIAFGVNIKGANPATASRLEYSVPVTSHVNLSVFDLQGRNIRTLVDQDAAPGSFVTHWDGATDNGARAQSGVYFVRMKSGAQVSEKKVVLQ